MAITVVMTKEILMAIELVIPLTMRGMEMAITISSMVYMAMEIDGR